MSQNDCLSKRKLYIVSTVILLLIYSLCCFVILPIYIDMLSNVMYENSFMPDAMLYLNTLLELLAIAVFYGVLIFGTYKFCPSDFKGALLIFILATLYKYAANVIMDWYKNGSVPLEWLWDVIDMVFYTVLEAIPLLIIFALTKSILNRHAQKERAFAKVGKSISVYPFEGIYDKNNPLQKSAFVCALVVFFSKLLGSLTNDIAIIIESGFPKETKTIWLMLIAYVSNVIFGLLCFIITSLTLIKLMDRYSVSPEEK